MHVGGGPEPPPHVPCDAPGGMLHGWPSQQSAVVVHAPPVGTHGAAAHTRGGVPEGFGTHGRPQQSALDAQAWPTFEPASVQSPGPMRQRGIPR